MYAGSNPVIEEVYEGSTIQDYLTEKTGELFGLIHDYMNEEGKDVFTSLFIYFMAIVDEDEERIAEEISKISQEGGKIAMTTYTRLINKGIKNFNLFLFVL